MNHVGVDSELLFFGQVDLDHATSELVDDVNPTAFELVLVESLETRKRVVELLRQGDRLPRLGRLPCAVLVPKLLLA